MANKAVSIKLFGYFEIKTDFGSLRESEIKSKQICKFIAYLVLNRNSVISSDVLSAILWPQGVEDPYASLRGLAHRTKRLLAPAIGGEDFIIAKNGAYVINSDYTLSVDAEELEELVNLYKSSGALTPDGLRIGAEFLNKCTGAFLESLASDVWCITVGTFYNTRLLSYFSAVCEGLLKAKMYDSAIHYASHGLQIDPLSEELHTKVASAMLAQGSRKLALDYYQRILNMFKNDYGISPTSHFTDFKKKLVDPENY